MNQDNVLAIITNLVKSDSLPNIALKKGTPIAAILESLSMACKRDPDASDAEAAQRWVTELYGFNDPRLSQQMDDIVSALVKGLEGSVDTIKSIHTIVDDLVAQIDTQVDRGIALDPKLTQLVAADKADISFQQVDFGPLRVLGASLSSAMEEFVGVPKDSPRAAYISVTERYIQMRGKGVPTQIAVSTEDKTLLIKTCEFFS